MFVYNTFGMEKDRMKMKWEWIKRKWTALFQTICNGNVQHCSPFWKLAMTIQNGPNGLKWVSQTGPYLFNPTHYWGNLHDHHARPYTILYLDPCCNCHHKETSQATGDQTRLPLKTKESHCPSMSTRIWTVIWSYLSIWKYCTKIQSHTHGPLQSIQITKVKLS